MSKNKELVAEAVAAIPLWIAFLDKKEAEQDALLEEMQGEKKETFMQKMASRLNPKKDQPAPATQDVIDEEKIMVDSSVIPVEEELNHGAEKKELLDKEELRWAPETAVEEEEKEEEEEEEEEENQLQDLF